MLPSSPRVRALAEALAAAAALLAFVATSPPPSNSGAQPDPTTDPDVVPPAQDLSAALVLHNGLAESAVVRLRRLDAAVDVDCGAILADPGALMSEALLGPTQSWTIPAGDNLGIDATAGRTCEVLRIEGDGFAPRWAVWDPGGRGAQVYRPDEEPTGASVLRLSAEGSGVALEGPLDLLFVPDEPVHGTEQCAPVADGQRVEWGDPLPSGGLVTSAVWGPDGCGSVVFSPDGETPQSPWYVCVPEAAWPFVPGDRVGVSSLFGSGSEGVEVVAEADDGTVLRRLLVLRASERASLDVLTVAYLPGDDCGYDVEATCGTVSRVGRVEVSVPTGVSVSLAAGETVEGLELPESTMRTRVQVLAAQERVALDPECALGPDVLGPDMALVVTQTETEVE